MNIEDSYFCTTCNRFAMETEVTEDCSHDANFGGCGGHIVKYGMNSYIDQKIRNSIEGKHALDYDQKYHDPYEGTKGMIFVGGMALVFTVAAIALARYYLK